MPHYIEMDTSNYLELFDSYIDTTSTELFIAESLYIHDTFEYNHFNELLEESANLLKSKGYRFDPHTHYIELQRYNVSGRTKPHYDWHVDDNGPLKCKVVSIIYYLRKDDTIKGGDLAFFRKKFKTHSNLAITFKGNKYHRATDMNGYGIRDSIVVMFKRF